MHPRVARRALPPQQPPPRITADQIIAEVSHWPHEAAEDLIRELASVRHATPDPAPWTAAS
jgi:hypothetical protein